MLVMGILFIVFPESSLKFACYAAGAVALLWGAVRFALCFKKGERKKGYDIILNLVIVAAGVLLLLAPDFIAGIITVLLGVLLIADSLLKLSEGYSLYKLGWKGWVAMSVTGAVCAVLGLIAVFNPFASMRILMSFVGISMLVDSALSIILLIYTAAKSIRAEEEEKNGGRDDNVIDI